MSDVGNHGNVEGDDLFKCSFCGKSQKQVKRLIAGPNVYICGECIDLCNEIIEEEEVAEASDVKPDELSDPVEIHEVPGQEVINQNDAEHTLAFEQPDDADQLRKTIAEQRQLIELLEARLDDLAELDSTKKSVTSIDAASIDWEKVSGDERARLCHDLGEFVGRLVRRLDLHAEITPCWWRHPRAVEELTVLMGARKVAYAEGADLSMPSWWQDLFERIRIRLKIELAACRDTGHIAARPDPWMTDDERAAFAAVLLGQASTVETDQPTEMSAGRDPIPAQPDRDR